MQFTKKNLYRKVNTKARGVFHHTGIDYRYLRHKKRETIEQVKGSMHSKVQRGYDYTPLFKFLLKKVGSNWNEVHSEAVSRLDKPDPIFWMVAIHEHEKQEYFMAGESSYFSGMYVNEEGILKLTNPLLQSSDIKPSCHCCTYTLNGEIFNSKYEKNE